MALMEHGVGGEGGGGYEIHSENLTLEQNGNESEGYTISM